MDNTVNTGFTSKVKFNFGAFLHDQRKDLKEVASKSGLTYDQLYWAARRGTLLYSSIRKLENAFGKLDQYITPLN